MESNRQKRRMPAGKAGKVLLNLLITLVVGAVYFYVALPALNPQSGDFYTFIALLCLVYVICALITSGFHLEAGASSPRGQLKEYFRFIRQQCLPIGILFLAMVVVVVVGQVVSLPLFRAAAYRDLLTVENGEFTQDISQISFNEIPTLDRDSANYLGDRQMGTLSDMVSQFEYSNDSTQINYQGRPVRVAPIAYADLIKWFTNRGGGLPAYVLVDMVSQEATVVRLPEGEGMKYSFSEPLNRNIMRHLRFHYPTYMFDTPQFEINEEGTPYWIAPRIVKTIGLFGGTDIDGAVLCNAITGECQYYDIADVPTWVDNVYTPDLIMEQYNYHGTLVNGFLNSIFGQRDVTVVTDGSNYIALNDDVYMYTGVTSINSDQSNLGFLGGNQRTKETKFYSAPGATEAAAQASAQGVVQDLGYIATFPLLLNIAGEPTYFIPLKDAANLVKSYAMVNVARYDIVATGNSVNQCEQEYVRLLADRGVTAQEELPQTQTEGTVAEIRSAVLDGTTYYFLRLEDEEVFYAVSASASPTAVLLDVGDWVSIEYGLSEEENGEIRSGSVLLDYRKSASSDADRGVSSSSHASDPESAPSSSPAPAR
ncbi:MAG TPA: CvpA family protein [Candidatus Flavonifractor intestinipullorum]|uniref:CvpA family protein n=1 Tax=Candidatus Flavonifractor intestinipullorum TaxID=2838587 RepID=A0A9D2S5I1_9FIRM|nr:CvpA family protein [Candidatus Flavonifractor intestinipullorum]